MLALCLITVAAKVSYDGHKVYRLSLGEFTNRESYSWLRDNAHIWGLDFWSDSDVRVSPDSETKFLEYLNKSHITASIMISDVQHLLAMERLNLDAPLYAGSVPGISFFKDYHKLDDINKFMDDIVSTYPKLARKITIGQTYENRSIHGVVVTGAGQGSSKPGIYYEGGIHAREWIAHTSVSYVMFMLVDSYGKDANITKLVDSIEWTFIPALNGDGYVYTWEHDRMWRKTRSPNKKSACVGTDPNRNWGSHWCEEGASTQPCSDSYCGASAFSESETKASADWVCAHKNIKAFIDFHAYSQLWMRPYGYTGKETADAREQTEVGKLAVAAIKATHGKVYQEGTIYNIIYPASGSSADYVYDTCKVKFAFGVELRDTGEHGFVLPASEIVPTGEEIFAATVQLARYVLSH